MKKTIKAIATIAVLALTGCTQAEDAQAAQTITTQNHMVSAEIADVTDGIVTLTYQDAAGHWCAVAIRASWADDAAAHLNDMVTYDTQSGTVRLDGGIAA
ncbi:hypothetical protein [Faecalibaculum rodentium]|uniref:hypothetical protein n=1 Tax=Faecalibaculum rodentium TaxID=1702221 RepID=UPI0023F29A78|nr:hypothetical protein [Faecalibaculum rodentium]